MARMLTCNKCKTVDLLPNYDSVNDPEAKYDHRLQDAIHKHLGKYGGGPDEHPAQLFFIEDEELALIDESKLQQAVHDGRLEEFLKEERNQYKEDAMGCYNLHNRPTYGIGYGPGCPDYRTKAKAIGKTAGLPPEEWTYLCDFCVYGSYVEHYKNKKAGIG